MPRNRTDFRDAQKAEIFVRDRATCCFSGANLWILDSPLKFDTETDWVDHVKPASRGGISDRFNGVCASHTFNAKKRNNSSDKAYLFLEGVPTPLYYIVHGTPAPESFSRLIRLRELQAADWLFNRMIANLLVAFNSRWSPDPLKSRQEDHWIKAAHRRAREFAKHEKKTIEGRLLISPSSTQQMLLDLPQHADPSLFARKAMDLYPDFRRNSDIWWQYFYPEEAVSQNTPSICDRLRHKAYEKALSTRTSLHPATFDGIHSDYSLRFSKTEASPGLLAGHS